MTVNPMHTMKRFSQAQAELKGLSGGLEASTEGVGSVEVEDGFRRSAVRLDLATQELAQDHANKGDLLIALRTDILRCASLGGYLQERRESGLGIPKNFEAKLDASLQHADEAFTECARPAGPAPESATPVQLLKRLSETQGELSYLDGLLTGLEAEEKRVPEDLHDQVERVAGHLYDARQAFHSLYPEQAELYERLTEDVLHLATEGGRLAFKGEKMETLQSRYWFSSMDGAMAHVDKAIAYLAG